MHAWVQGIVDSLPHQSSLIGVVPSAYLGDSILARYVPRGATLSDGEIYECINARAEELWEVFYRSEEGLFFYAREFHGNPFKENYRVHNSSKQFNAIQNIPFEQNYCIHGNRVTPFFEAHCVCPPPCRSTSEAAERFRGSTNLGLGFGG